MRLEAGHKAEWLAEYRRVFIMFCKLPGTFWNKEVDGRV
jgi:hypothetical protein